MPRTTTNLQFIIQRLRYIAASKKASEATKIRALDRLAVIESRQASGLHWAYDVQVKEQEPQSGEKPENLSGDGLDDTVKAMLDRAMKNRRS